MCDRRVVIPQITMDTSTERDICPTKCSQCYFNCCMLLQKQERMTSFFLSHVPADGAWEHNSNTYRCAYTSLFCGNRWFMIHARGCGKDCWSKEANSWGHYAFRAPKEILWRCLLIAISESTERRCCKGCCSFLFADRFISWLSKAEEMLRAALKWRQENNIFGIRAEEVESQVLAGRMLMPNRLKSFRSWNSFRHVHTWIWIAWRAYLCAKDAHRCW